MSDLEMLELMFSKAGVVFDTSDPYPESPEDVSRMLVVQANNGPEKGSNQGYSGFFTEFHFDSSGGLLSVGAWE